MPRSFDAFLSYNSHDREAVRPLAEALRDRGERIWFGEWELLPGQLWQEELERVLSTTRAAVVCIGPSGIGPWEERELRAALSEFVSRKLPVIPVLLPGASRLPTLPLFLRAFSWVDLRSGISAEGLDRLVWGISGTKPSARQAVPERDAGIVLETLEIRNFKNIEHLSLNFAASSSLPGRWTCIAGINGAGKSAILQAAAMVLLGERQVTELGGGTLQRMLRRQGEERLDAEITATLRWGREICTLFLPLSDQGVDRAKLYLHPEFPRMSELWEHLQAQVVVAYGASRNLSPSRGRNIENTSLAVQRQLTLFDARAELGSENLLLGGGSDPDPAFLTLQTLLLKILADEVTPEITFKLDRIDFGQSAARVDALDLPDGFRSTVVWLADLCTAWHRTAPPEAVQHRTDLTRIRALVLLDELDLHLHPSLQRAIVPRLREALPNVQFVVTTHSPLVLSSFDRNELIVLDSDEEGGVRELDRDILGFSADQIYEWLMRTPPQSLVIEEKLRDGGDPNLGLYLYQSADANEEEARAKIEERRRLFAEFLGPEKG